MKTNIVAIAIAAVFSVGMAGTASAAAPAPATNLVAPAIQFDAADNGLVQARKGKKKFGRKFHRGYYKKHRFYYHGPYGYGRCKKFYHLGYVKGVKRYRLLYRKYCRHY